MPFMIPLELPSSIAFCNSSPLGKAIQPINLGFSQPLSVVKEDSTVKGWVITQCYNNSQLSTLTHFNFNTVKFEIVILTRIRKEIQIYKHSHFPIYFLTVYSVTAKFTVISQYTTNCIIQIPPTQTVITLLALREQGILLDLEIALNKPRAKNNHHWHFALPKL